MFISSLSSISVNHTNTSGGKVKKTLFKINVGVDAYVKHRERHI